MSQRESGYERIAFDRYETPSWATAALVPHIPGYVKSVLEPACGTGKMVDVLAPLFTVTASDIQEGQDFFGVLACPDDAIVTNPPYAIAQDFIEHALHLVQPQRGFVAMLLRCDYDHAKSRRHLFANHEAFAKKLVLTKRIKWIEDSKGSPSFNHAWFIWDWRNLRDPVIAYDFQGD